MTRDDLIKAAEAAISATRKDRSVITGDSEPNQVARIVAGLPDELIDKWKPYVKKGAITISSIFCHAKPFVDWESPFDPKKRKHPELADLLIILDGPGYQERALLLQAKVGKGGQFTVYKGGPQAQRYMYARWPEFSVRGVVSALTQPNTPTDIKCTPDIGTRYICVDEDENAPQSWLLEDKPATFVKSRGATSFDDIATKKYKGTKSLAEALVEMSEGKIGRLTNQNDDWSKLIDYLVDFAHHNQTSSAVLSHASVASGASPVFIGKAVSFLSTSLFVDLNKKNNVWPEIIWPQLWGKRHLFPADSLWCDPRWISHRRGGGAFINWFSPPSLPEGEGYMLDGNGFGIIRIVVDEPFSDEEPRG